MLSPDPPARLPQLTPAQFNDDVRKFFGKWTMGRPEENPPLLTFAHHPKLADRYSPFSIHLLMTTTLPIKQRQIAIMRTAWLCNAAYVWSSHLRTSLSAGVSPDIFHPIQVGPDDLYFTPFERTIMLSTEELVVTKRVTDDNWRALSAEWNEQQLLDFLFTVGAYVMLAGVMRSTGVERERELLELAERYGAPPAD